MAQSIFGLAVEELGDLGWQIMYADHTGQPIAIRAIVDHWDSLSWAYQTFYRAKYGFNRVGLLEFSLSEVSSNRMASDCIHRSLLSDRDFTPGGNTSGSNDRLRTILEQSRVNVEASRYDYNALIHIGPDDTAILTGMAGWGPVSIASPSDYAELDDRYTCYWETSSPNWVPEAPDWATNSNNL